jgi:uncharacterized membrane protein
MLARMLRSITIRLFDRRRRVARYDACMSEAAAVPRLASDLHRNTISLAIATVCTLVAFFVYRVLVPFGFTPGVVAVTAFVFWIFYSISLAVLAQVAFRRVDGETLKRWLIATTPTRRVEQVEAMLAGAGPSINVTWSVLALAAVGLILVIPGLIDSVLANALGFGVVISSWIVTIYAYAVHYARVNSIEPSIEFPGPDAQPTFADYFYLSAQIATTFSSSDVNVLTTRARRIVTGQTLIAFVFSTFIIALLISVLFLSN